MALPSLTTSQRAIRMRDAAKERAVRWVQSQAATTHRSPADAPFKRLIDFWFAAIAWAVAHNIRPVEQCAGDKFVSIGPTPSDVRIEQWKTDMLTLLALNEYGHEDPRAQNPAEIIDLANRFAEAGTEPFLDELDGAREFAVPMLYKVTDIFVDQFATAISGHDETY